MQETRHACKVYHPKEGREHVLFSQRVVQDDEKVSRWAFMDPFLLLFFFSFVPLFCQLRLLLTFLNLEERGKMNEGRPERDQARNYTGFGVPLFDEALWL